MKKEDIRKNLSLIIMTDQVVDEIADLYIISYNMKVNR